MDPEKCIPRSTPVEKTKKINNRPKRELLLINPALEGDLLNNNNNNHNNHNNHPRD